MAGLLVLLFALAVSPVSAQGPPTGGASTAPAAERSGERGAVQHGAQPDPGDVRPGSPSGNAPSASIGTLDRERQARRIFGLPVNAALVIAGVIVGIAILGGLVVPRTRKSRQARGNGAWGGQGTTRDRPPDSR